MLCVYAVKLLVCERAVATASSLYMCGYEQFDLRACVFASFLGKAMVDGMCESDNISVTCVGVSRGLAILLILPPHPARQYTCHKSAVTTAMIANESAYAYMHDACVHSFAGFACSA